MSNEIYNKNSGNPGDWYEFKEKNTLSSSSSYYKDEEYTGIYSIKNKITYEATISLKTLSSEISLDVDAPFTVSPGEKKEMKIVFKPISIGEKKFKLYLAFYGESKSIVLLDKKLQVKEKSILVEGKVEKKLPTSMKLGQKSETIFLFTNKGNQMVTDVSIDIKQIEST